MTDKDYGSELDELLDYHFWSLDKSKQTNRLSIEEAKVKLTALLRRVEVEAKLEEAKYILNGWGHYENGSGTLVADPDSLPLHIKELEAEL